MITVYSTQTCPWCHKTKELLKTNNKEFKDVDVGRDRQAAMEMVQKSGQMGVPVIDIDGEIIVGFDKERISELLNIKT